MFDAIVFLRIRCDRVVYCLRSNGPRTFFFPPPELSTVAIERDLGDCTVEQLRQCIIRPEEHKPDRRGCTVDLMCVEERSEVVVTGLTKTGRWKIVPSSTIAFLENGDVDHEFTTKLRKGFSECRLS